MGIMVTKNDDLNQDLTKRIDADLREKVEATSKNEKGAGVDFAEDSEYVEGFKKTSKFAWIWIAGILIAILTLIIAGINR